VGRYAAFLRGINLGNRRVTGKELCASFEELGFTQVASFLASGNVAFRIAEDPAPEELSGRIAAALEPRLGYPVLTFVRTATELAVLVSRTPFPPGALERTAGKLQVLLLPREPDADAARAALAHASDQDLLHLHGQELWWLPSGGMSQSDLDLDAIGRLIGPVTIRTANTLARMHAKFFASA
jgi:uncharacterized protein (DUF1697 family)